MKSLSKILVLTVCFSFAAAFCAYAEEVKPQETAVAAPEAATAPAAVSEAVSVAPAAVPAPVEKTTLDNLQAAFDGESNANARYLAFAKKADEEGYGKVASLFRAAARAEQVHFERHAKVIKALGGVPTAKIETPDVKNTAENLEAAMKGEIYESTVMYPEFLAQAEKDDNQDAVDSFEDAEKAEAIHAGLYKEALADLPVWKRKNKDFYVCPFCGNVVERTNFRFCPICGEMKQKFLEVK